MYGFAAGSDTISRISFVVYDSIFAKRSSTNNQPKQIKGLSSVTNEERSLNIKNKHFLDDTAKAMKSSLAAFICKICRACFVEESSLILSLIYLDRIFLKQQIFLDIESLYKVVVGCIIAAVKYNQDYHSLNMMQSITAIQPHHLVSIETWALEALSYKLYVDQIIYETYAFHLSSFKLSI